MTKQTVGWGLIILTAGLVGAALCRPAIPAWHDAPQPLQSAVQPPAGRGLELGHGDPLGASVAVLDGLEGCQQNNGRPVAVECLEGMPRCPYEGGDPSGRPCLWVDHSGEIYYVSSSEYRP